MRSPSAFQQLCSVAAVTAVCATSFAQTQPAAAPASTQPTTVVASSSVSAFYTADLYAKDSGYVLDVSADIGDHGKKGQVLATIDDPELKQQLAGNEAVLAAKKETAKAADAGVQQAQSAVEVAKRQVVALEADLKLTEATLKRQEALFADKAVTGQQMDEMRAKADVAGAAASVGQAKIAAAEADLAAAQANRGVAAAQVTVAAADVERMRTLLGYTEVLAPFDGVITKRWVNPGDLAQSGTGSRTAPLFTCQKLDVVRIVCEVPEANVGGVRKGTRADVRLFGPGGQTVQGAVSRVATSVDPTTRTMRAEIDLPNPDEALRPGMYAQVTLTPQAAEPVAKATAQP